MAGIDGQSRFLESLTGAQENGKAVAIYSEQDDNQAYEVGFVEFADQREVVLLCLTPKGEPDGRRAFRMEDVVRIDSDNAYTRKLELLYQYRDSVFDKDFRTRPGHITGDLKSQLSHAMDTGSIVHLVDSNDYGPTGFVSSVGDDYVEMKRIGTNGEPDGSSTILVNNIAKIHIGRRQEQMLEFLHRYNYELKNLLDN